MNALRFACAALVMVLASGCSDGARGGDAGGGGPDGSGDGTGAIEHPGGSALVVRMSSAGGFVPREFVLSSVPAFTLLGDGRVIVAGPQPAIFPGPALPNLMERRLTEDGIQAVLRLLADTQLFGDDAEFNGASNFVADAATTVFTVNAGGTTVNVSIYGLGTLPPEGQGGGPEMPAVERVAHERLAQVANRLTALDLWLPAEAWVDDEYRGYIPDAVRLYVRDADGDPPDPSGIQPQEREWPLDAPLADFGDEPTADAPDFRCGVVTGDHADRLLEVLADANQLTRWSSDGTLYALIVRPLLLDEPPDCA